jgi:NhaP-type Na+/H+ or K+/H+ antiporter
VKPLIALAVVLIGWALVSARAARFSITVPVALMLAGALISGTDDPHAVVDIAAVRHLLEATLGLILFTDALDLRPRGLQAAGHLGVRLLLVAFPLTVVAGVLTGMALFPDSSLWILALVASALAASDSSLAHALLHGDRVPAEVRAAVNVESGLNDGLAAPLVLFFLSASLSGQGFSVLRHALTELVIALAVGGAVGNLTARLLRGARTRGWGTARSQRLAYPAIGALAFGAAYALHGNVLVAAFAAGLCVRAADPDLPEDREELSHDVVVLLSSAVWFAFGAVVPGALSGLSWAVLAYAVLSLTLIRMGPVVVSLVGVRRPWRDKLLLAWLGPAGLPSVILGLLALEQLSGMAAELVAVLVTATVLLSVFLHGLTAEPIARRF